MQTKISLKFLAICTILHSSLLFSTIAQTDSVMIYNTHGSSNQTSWTAVTGTPNDIDPANIVLQNGLVRITYPCLYGARISPSGNYGTQKASHVLYCKVGSSWVTETAYNTDAYWGDWTYSGGSQSDDYTSFNIIQNTSDVAEIELSFANHLMEDPPGTCPISKHIILRRGFYGYTAINQVTPSVNDGEFELGFAGSTSHFFTYSTAFGYLWSTTSPQHNYQFLRDQNSATADLWGAGLAFTNNYYRIVALKPLGPPQATIRAYQFQAGMTAGLIRYNNYKAPWGDYEVFIGVVPYDGTKAKTITVNGNTATVNVPKQGHYILFTKNTASKRGDSYKYDIVFPDLILDAGSNTIDITGKKLVEPLIAPLFNGIDFPLDISLKYIGAESEPPSEPSNIIATNVTESEFSLQWTESVDNVGVLAYDIYKDRKLIGKSNSATFNVTGCKCDTSVTITIIARDAAGNRSNPSSASVTTLACKTTGYKPATNSEPLEIIPNPATDQFTIKGASATADVKIYSATGVLAAQYTNIESPIDISALSGGMYFIKVTENNNLRVLKACKIR